MKLEIVSPDGILFEGEAERVSFPGMVGSFDILPHHAPLIAALRQGAIQYLSLIHISEPTRLLSVRCV